jgi:DNA-binding LacI/PurR family transcriptional regulator
MVAVNDAIKKTGYRINPHARSLATSRSDSVAFLLTEPQHLLFDDPNFAVLLRGAASALSERDISLVLMIADDPREQARATEFLTSGHVDGVLLVSSHSGNPLVGNLVKAGIPAISVGQPLGYEGLIGCVSADDLNGARRMVEYLLESGRTRIAHIAGPLDTSGGSGRLAGYRAALGDRFDERLVAHGDYGRASGMAAMKELLERAPDIDAVFAANDGMAVAAMSELQARGIDVPGRIAVAGFDDSGFASAATPALTTMRQPFERISSEMVRLLVDAMNGAPPAAVTLPATLVRRESA